MYTAIIMDDEERGRNTLYKMVSDYCPDIDVVALCSSGEEAYSEVLKHHPQILFLDIEIGQAGSSYGTSFDLLAKLPNYHYELVFVTAYEHYAFKAIQNHAIGFVLKPVSIEDLVDAVNVCIEKLQLKGVNERLSDLLNQVNKNTTYPDKLWIHSQKDIVPLNLDEVIRFEAQGKYTDIHCEKEKKITSSKNMGEYLELLNPDLFIKVHRSHIVNIDKVIKYSKTDGGWVTTADGIDLPVSKNGKERLLKML